VQPLQPRSYLERLIKSPVNKRLVIDDQTRWDVMSESVAYLNSMTNVPTRFATLLLSQAMEMSKMTLALVRLKRTR